MLRLVSSVTICSRAGWSLASLELLICEALTLQSGRPAVAQPTAGGPPEEAPTLLLSAASTLAHMLEAYFRKGVTSVTQHRGQQQHHQLLAEPATKLHTLLSLIAFVGSLSCPVAGHSGSHSPKPPAAQHREQHCREDSPAASEHPDDAQAQVETRGDGESVREQSKQEPDVQGSPESQDTRSVNERKQLPSASARQCQKICLQVSLMHTMVCCV